MTETTIYYVCVNYKNNARPLDDSASGEYQREFTSKRAAWAYIQKVGQRATAKPWMTVDVTVVDNKTWAHRWRNIWNAR